MGIAPANAPPRERDKKGPVSLTKTTGLPRAKRRAVAQRRPPAEGNRTRLTYLYGQTRYFLTWPEWISPDQVPVGCGRCSMNALKRFRSFSTLRGVAWVSLSPISPTAPFGGS